MDGACDFEAATEAESLLLISAVFAVIFPMTSRSSGDDDKGGYLLLCVSLASWCRTSQFRVLASNASTSRTDFLVGESGGAVRCAPPSFAGSGASLSNVANVAARWAALVSALS